MAKEYEGLLQHPGLHKPIPPQWLHSTILRVGSLEDYTEDEMLAVTEKLQSSLAPLTLPEFVFDSWWLWGCNVVLHITPDDQFTKIYDAVISTLESVVGVERTTKTPHVHFIAHTALAYTKTHNKEVEVNRILASHPVKPASFRATSLSLLKQWPIDGHYEWEIVKDIPINQGNQ
jgi:2'-5' RNA ligase